MHTVPTGRYKARIVDHTTNPKTRRLAVEFALLEVPGGFSLFAHFENTALGLMRSSALLAAAADCRPIGKANNIDDALGKILFIEVDERFKKAYNFDISYNVVTKFVAWNNNLKLVHSK